ncbi:MAG: FAD-dependent oxidoreductase [Chloroflexi bacterium]|nr:FAD-dependent oxidoreductase [Chloroflexota bacterium]
MSQTVVVGGGPAGLAAAYRLAQHPEQSVLLLERALGLGGLAAGFRHGDYTLDFGPHRLHAAVDPLILEELRRLLGDELLWRPRRGLIRLGDRFLPYPIGPASMLHLGPSRLLGIGAGLLVRQVTPTSGTPVSYEAALKARVGQPLYRLFYGPYAEKVWGLPGSLIAADQAERRVNQRGLADFVRLALGRNAAGQYLYPRGGFGRIPAVYAQALASMPGANVECSADVEKIEWGPDGLRTIHYSKGDRRVQARADQLIWTASIPELMRRLDPAPPRDIQEAASHLRYRAVVLCYVVLAIPCVGQADTYYFPESRFPFNRVTEQKNFSVATVPSDRTVLCLDLVCDAADDLFALSDEQLGNLVIPLLEEVGLARASQVVEVFSRRFAQAYPVYDLDYRAALSQTLGWLADLQNLWLIGRHGLFIHDNVHHSLLMGHRAAETLAAGERGFWPAALAQFATFRVAD